jgi:hypothetical protein
MTSEIQVMARDRHKHMAGLNRLLGSQPFPLNNWILNNKTCINKLYKTCTDSLPLKMNT